MGATIGKFDPNATNQVDANGNTVATNTPGSKTVNDPNGGLSGGQRAARSGLKSLSGLGNALQQYGQPQGNGAYTPIQAPPQPQVSPDYFQQNKLGMQKGPNPQSLFFGGY
jgi:hypothetical protein